MTEGGFAALAAELRERIRTRGRIRTCDLPSNSGNLQSPARPARTMWRGRVMPKDGEHLAMLAGLRARAPTGGG